MLTLDDGLLIDIGGGSTELVLYEKGKVKQARSLSIGSLSLYKKYITNFLPTEKEIMKIRKNVLKNLRELDDYIEMNKVKHYNYINDYVAERFNHFSFIQNLACHFDCIYDLKKSELFIPLALSENIYSEPDSRKSLA